MDFLESIFRRSSPEVQKKQQLKKLEAEARAFTPPIYKNGNLLPNFGEAIFTLYKNMRPLDAIFTATTASEDLQRRKRFESQLVITGYMPEDQELIDSFEFEKRKEEIVSEDNSFDRVYIRQRKKLEKITKELGTDTFRKLDSDLLMLRQFADFCHSNYFPLLQTFDPNFLPNDMSYTPAYLEVPLAKAVNVLEDMYYQMSGLKITTSTADAVLALAQLKSSTELSEKEKQSLMGNLKKINYVIKNIITVDNLKTIIRIAKASATYEPSVNSYRGSPSQTFGEMIQARFNADEQRIRSEIQAENISVELDALFAGEKLVEATGYNDEYNSFLQENTNLSFSWILPIKVVKNFILIFLTDPIVSLLEDLVIEGFFNNPTFKTEFSAKVYAVKGVPELMQGFEASFAAGERNSIETVQSYIADSRKNPEFQTNLDNLIKKINNEAHGVLQTISTALYDLSEDVGQILADSKKPSSELISNLKVLTMSSRNREKTALLDSQFQKWSVFFEVMKNYVIIKEEEKRV